MTVAEVLQDFGWPLGTRHDGGGRTTCPVHRGSNPQSFSYTTETWHCFACGVNGNAYGLALRLGLVRKARTIHVLGGVTSLPELERTPRPQPLLRQLERLVRERAERARDDAVATHRQAQTDLVDLRLLYATAATAGAVDAFFDDLVAWAGDAWAELVEADRALGCNCSALS